eukprot:c21748_g2_i2 orf=646-1770(+)
MDLGAQQESSLTMPIPMNYGSIHESSKFRMLGGPVINGPLHMSSGAAPPRAPLAAPPPPPPPPVPAAPQPGAEELSHTRLASLAPGPGSPALAPVVSEPMIPTAGPTTGGLPPSFASKKPVKYRECLKNHAASIGTHALDGCGEFMPSGEEGSLEALKCAACRCHRNFHRKEVEGEVLSGSCGFCYSPRSGMMKDSRRRFAPLAALPPHTPLALPPSPAVGPGAPPRTISQQTPLPLHMSLHSPPDGTTVAGDDHHHHHPQDLHAPHHSMMGIHHHHFGHSSSSMKKRFRTKFSSEQKDKMFSFAEKLGWRIQKHDEAAVHQFCADTGVKRHVFKVWMHNNKNTFGKKISPNGGGVVYLDNGGSSPTTSSGLQP